MPGLAAFAKVSSGLSGAWGLGTEGILLGKRDQGLTRSPLDLARTKLLHPEWIHNFGASIGLDSGGKLALWCVDTIPLARTCLVLPLNEAVPPRVRRVEAVQYQPPDKGGTAQCAGRWGSEIISHASRAGGLDRTHGLRGPVGGGQSLIVAGWRPRHNPSQPF
ncbi:hypothetical protein BGZ61DRAFT_557609 [Ilyonectria robusta]|uniref:uncharacterized protein n=1 Tax=Ilyonectria robusta TaxID=1079257 RepID=UPI001E8ECDBB|nr:uncharacterized protein BGZ61DRAFT_557609 [Ilyonectria robusta]KAH8669264.1 hypothetical protein BGZ61DRAFT_557609 [Ilyonectria robusta]